MDRNMKWVNEEKILRTIKSLEQNNMNGYLVSSNEELINKITELVNSGDKVSCGGSVSLEECGVMNHLRSGIYEFLDRSKSGLTAEDIDKLYRETFFVDVYFSSSNAITEDGELYNVDGNGNRVAALLFGPKRVIIIAGVNKIVKSLDEAIKRNREIAAPANAKRLNKNTPCTKVGYCMNCTSHDKICREYTLIKSQKDKNRIHVIFINDTIGY